MEANKIEDSKKNIEEPTASTIMEDKIFEDSENNQNDHDASICGENPCPQQKNQNWDTPCIKSELDHSTTSASHAGTLDNSHHNEIMKKENTCVDNKDALYNGSCSLESLEYDMDVNTTSDDLRQFDVLDDLDRHTEQNCSDADSDTDESMDSDVPDEEIEAMLEEGIF